MGEVLDSVIENLQKQAQEQMDLENRKGNIKEEMGLPYAMSRGFGDMLTFNNVDDMVGTFTNLNEFYKQNGFSGILNPTIWRKFSSQKGADAKAESQQKSEDASIGYPVGYTVGQAGGLVAPAIVPYGGQIRIANALKEGVKSWKAWGTATGLGVTAESLNLMGQDKFNYVEALRDGSMMGILGWSIGGVGNRVAPPVMDFLKRTFGESLSNRATEMLVDAIKRDGVTPDQAIVDVIRTMKKDGLSPVEASKDLTDMIDNIANSNPAVMKLVKSLLEGDELLSTSRIKSRLQGELAPNTTPLTNIDKYYNDIKKEIKQNQKEQYTKIFQTWTKNGNVPPQDLTNAVHHILKNDSDMAQILLGKIKRNKLYENEDGYRKVNEFFKIGEKGEIEFLEPPSLEAMEIMRRAMAKRATKIFKNQSDAFDTDDANVFNDIEKSLRAKIDDASEKASEKDKIDATIGGVRQKFANEEYALEQYEIGRKLFSSGNTDIEKTMNTIQDVIDSGNEQALDYLKLGVMNRINNMFYKAQSSAGSDLTELDKFLAKMGKTQKSGEAQSSERLIYEALFPDSDITSTMKLAKRALESRRVSGAILSNSATAKRLKGGEYLSAGNRLSSDITEAVIDTATMGAPVRTLYNKLTGLKKKYGGQITTSELLDLTRFALSRNPEYVERVLNMSDKKAWESVTRLGNKMYGTAPVSVGMLGSSADFDIKETAPMRMF
jgi:hypothetical protein